VSVRDEIAAAHALLRESAPRIDPARAPAVAALRAARVRVAAEAVMSELLWAVTGAFPATARVLSALEDGTTGWLEDYLRSEELRGRPPSTRFATLAQVAATFPAFARRRAAGAPANVLANVLADVFAYLAPLFADALASETVINDLRQPDPGLAAVLHRLSGPFARTNGLLRPAALGDAPVALARHARLGVYGRDVAALQAAARSRLAGFLTPREWTAALGTNPAFAVRPGPYHAAHVLLPSGEVTTLQLEPVTHAALAAGPARPGDPAPRRDLLRLAAAGALGVAS
jgi:hypothetical protein